MNYNLGHTLRVFQGFFTNTYIDPRCSRKPIEVFHREGKTREGFLENQKRRVLQKTVYGFSQV
jgi:hypothetical protein